MDEDIGNTLIEYHIHNDFKISQNNYLALKG